MLTIIEIDACCGMLVTGACASLLFIIFCGGKAVGRHMNVVGKVAVAHGVGLLAVVVAAAVAAVGPFAVVVAVGMVFVVTCSMMMLFFVPSDSSSWMGDPRSHRHNNHHRGRSYIHSNHKSHDYLCWCCCCCCGDIVSIHVGTDDAIIVNTYHHHRF